jgi:hypothetical protein
MTRKRRLTRSNRVDDFKKQLLTISAASQAQCVLHEIPDNCREQETPVTVGKSASH